MSNASRLVKLQDWMLANGITWDHAAVSITGGKHKDEGFSVQATQDIAEGHALCEIPKGAVLSVRNTAAAEIIETEQLGGGLGLILAIMYELSLGAASKWHGYLRSLPAREYLPIFWQDDELSMLQGTELDGKANADRELTQEDWETNLLPLLTQYSALNQPSMTLDSFRVAASWVASRAFGVDNYHGMAMVPFADLFNHKAAVVELAGGYFVEDVCMEGTVSSSDEEFDDPDDAPDDSGDANDTKACHQNGAAGDSSGDVHRSGDEPASTEEEEEDEEDEEELAENVVQPMTLEAERRGSTRGAMLDPDTQQDPKLRLEIGICGVTKADGTAVLEIVAASKLHAGQEIFNTYGEHGNAELINKYGFAVPDNPFDSIKMDKDALVARAADAVGDEACKQRCAFLHYHSHLLDEDLEPFEVLPKGRINPSLVMALRALYASSNSFSTWTNLADAVPSTSEPVAADEAEQYDDHGDAANPRHTADTLTDTHASSDPGDGHTPGKGSKKKRTSAENGSCASMEEDKQLSKRQKACSQSQTDKTAPKAHGEVSSQQGKLSRQSNCSGQHNGQLQIDGQSNGQHSRQHKGAERGDGHHKGDGPSNRHHTGPHHGRPRRDGRSDGQADVADNRQHRNGQAEVEDSRQHNHSSAQPLSKGTPRSDSEPVSDSCIGEELEDEDEEDEEAAETELGSLGNVGVATASSQVLSLSMLHGLKAGLQARLSLYATNTTAEDIQQLREVHGARLSSEGLQAQQAALLLRIAEKTILDDAMQAVDCAVSKQE